MERYTEKHYDGNGYYLICSGNCETFNCGDCGILDKIVDRLAAYEDTGLEPEEIIRNGMMFEDNKRYAGRLELKLKAYEKLGPIDRLRELAQADREGRCVVLPFKPPRWVYMCSTRFPKPAQAHYASAINVLQDMDKGCVFGDTQEEAAAALRRKQDEKGGSSE